MSSRSARLLLVAYAVCVALVVLQPEPAVATGTVTWIEEGLSDLGVPGVMTSPGVVEAVLNGLMFVPFGLLLPAALPGRRWWFPVPLALAGSVLVELIQWALLPDRSASVIDAIANTLGALLGAAAWRGRRTPHLNSPRDHGHGPI